MSLDVPYERLSATSKVDYIPLKLALNDLPEITDDSKHNTNFNDSKIDINVPEARNEIDTSPKQMYDTLVLGLLTFFCILVLLYAIYYFVILRDRQKPIIKDSYMF